MLLSPRNAENSVESPYREPQNLFKKRHVLTIHLNMDEIFPQTIKMPAESPPNLERHAPRGPCSSSARSPSTRRSAACAAASPSLHPSLSVSLSVPFSLTVSGRASDRRATLRCARVSPLGRAAVNSAAAVAAPGTSEIIGRTAKEEATESGQAESRSQRKRGCGDRLSKR